MKIKIIFLCLQAIIYCNIKGIDQTTAAESIKGLKNAISNTTLEDAVKETIKNVAQEAGNDAAEAAAEAILLELKNALNAGFTIYNLYSLLNDAVDSAIFIKNWVNPTQKEIYNTLKISIAYSYLKKKKDFRDCLVKNAHGKTNRHGRPKECEEIARHFASMGGNDDVEELTKIYKKTRKKYSRSFL